jgi:tight adherence protein B
MTRLRISPILLLSTLFVAAIALLGWILRTPLHAFTTDHPAFYPAIFFGTSLLCATFALVLLLESAGLKRTWLARSALVAELDGIKPPSLIESLGKVVPDPLEFISKPFFKIPIGKRLREEWIDADLGGKPSRYLLVLFLFSGGGFILGQRVGGVLLAVALFLICPLIPRAFVRNRAESYRHRFAEQLPYVLDGLASGLSAGLSFQGAVDFVLGELSDPSRSTFRRLSNRLSLGVPLQGALLQLQNDVDEEALSLVVDGLILQRQFGGDMVQMLGETAGLLRERIELEREVRAITTQGRLSGMIIAVLVPVSAGFLLTFNPRYIDVLFDTVIGQVLVILALVLQLIGWAIISRLVRISY